MKIFNFLYLKLLILYSTQYLPLGFFFGAIPAILGTNGVSMEIIGSIYMLGLFWVIKFLWAPFIDRYSLFNSKQHYKSWLYIIQPLLAISMFICAFYSITEYFIVSICLIALINLFSSVQDICVDGLVLNNVDKNELEYANAIQTIGTFIGSLLGLVLPLISYEIYSWKVTLIILSVLVLLPTLLLFTFDEKEKVQTSEKYSYFKMFSFLRQKSVLNILIIMLPGYWIVEGTFGLMQQLLIKYDWTLIQIASSQNLIGSIFGIISALIIGSIIEKIGKEKSYKYISVFVFLDILLMINHESFFTNHILVTALLSYNFFCLGLFMTIYYTYIMSNSSKEYAGTQVNIQHSFLLLLTMIFTKIIFSTTESYGFKVTFEVLAVIFVLSNIYGYLFFKRNKNAK